MKGLFKIKHLRLFKDDKKLVKWLISVCNGKAHIQFSIHSLIGEEFWGLLAHGLIIFKK